MPRLSPEERRRNRQKGLLKKCYTCPQSRRCRRAVYFAPDDMRVPKRNRNTDEIEWVLPRSGRMTKDMMQLDARGKKVVSAAKSVLAKASYEGSLMQQANNWAHEQAVTRWQRQDEDDPDLAEDDPGDNLGYDPEDDPGPGGGGGGGGRRQSNRRKRPPRHFDDSWVDFRPRPMRRSRKKRSKGR